jgi:hypothetical protein
MPPFVIAQGAQPTQAVPTLAEAPLWTYGLTYAHGHADQDDVVVTASFNVPEPVVEAAVVSDENQSGYSLAQQSYGFSVRLSDRAGNDGTSYLDTLVLTAAQAAPSPANQWPNAFCRGPDGTLVRLAAGPPSGSTVVYQAAADRIPASTWAFITLEWPGLNVTTVQNARGSLRTRRTPIVKASSAVAPLNVWPVPFDITGEGTTPVDALQGAFQTLFGTLDGELITIAVACRYRILPGTADDDGVVATVPVALLPYHMLGPGTAEEIGAAMRQWETSNPLLDAGGEWIFSLTFYCGIGGMSALPLLTLDRLTYRINRLLSQAQP